ncbi:MAG: DMT family transporter [Ignavibacteriaceae bacterium]|nr:DMT family transporter [Ignavibacteriaceae bacterium]
MSEKKIKFLKSDGFAPFYVILAASLWAIDGVALRPLLYNLPVSLVVFTESVIVAVLLTPIITKHTGSIKSLAYKDWFAFLGVAIFGGALGTMAITKALFYVNYVNLSIVILMQKLQPVFALLLAAIVLKERLPFNFFFWAAVAISGAYLMTFGFTIPDVNAGDKTHLAALFALIAAFSFGFSTVLSKRALLNVSFELGTYLRFAISAIVMLIIVTITRTITSIGMISSNQVIIFFLIAFTTGGTAIFLYYYGLKKISASVAAICELAFPLIAIVLEYVLRKNILGPVQWLGVMVLVVSIFKVSGFKISSFLKSKSK